MFNYMQTYGWNCTAYIGSTQLLLHLFDKYYAGSSAKYLKLKPTFFY